MSGMGHLWCLRPFEFLHFLSSRLNNLRYLILIFHIFIINLSGRRVTTSNKEKSTTIKKRETQALCEGLIITLSPQHPSPLFNIFLLSYVAAHFNKAVYQGLYINTKKRKACQVIIYFFLKFYPAGISKKNHCIWINKRLSPNPACPSRIILSHFAQLCISGHLPSDLASFIALLLISDKRSWIVCSGFSFCPQHVHRPVNRRHKYFITSPLSLL